MSQNTPVPKKPDASAIAAISPPARQRAGFWTGIGAGVLGLLFTVANAAPQWLPDFLKWTGTLPPNQRFWLLLAALVLLGISAQFGGTRGTMASARVKEEVNEIKEALLAQGISVPAPRGVDGKPSGE